MKPNQKQPYTKTVEYSLSCNTCNLQYIGQTGRNLKTRFSEHCRYIKTNDPKSAYALHVLNNRHEYGPIETTMSLIRSCRKGSHMNTLENFYIQDYYQKDILIPEQQLGEHCILFNIVKEKKKRDRERKPQPNLQRMCNETTRKYVENQYQKPR